MEQRCLLGDHRPCRVARALHRRDPRPPHASERRRLRAPRLLLHLVTLGEQDALAEGGYVVLVSVPDPLRARLQRRFH